MRTYTLTQPLAKLNSIYCTIQVRETVLAEFYSTHQQTRKMCLHRVAIWRTCCPKLCSLGKDSVLSKAVQVGKGQCPETNEMLHCIFCTGLHQHLKEMSGHKFDAIKDCNRLPLPHIRKARILQWVWIEFIQTCRYVNNQSNWQIGNIYISWIHFH